MSRLTKKQLMYAHILEARKHRVMCNRRCDKYEERGLFEKAERNFREACDYAIKEDTFISAVTIVYGEHGCDLEVKLKAFAEVYMPDTVEFLEIKE